VIPRTDGFEAPYVTFTSQLRVNCLGVGRRRARGHNGGVTSSGGQERSDPGIGFGGQERSDPGVGSARLRVVVALAEMIKLLVQGRTAGAVLVALAGVVLIVVGAISEQRLRSALR